jgi:hypothetical protein
MREWPEIETHNGRSTFAAGTALHAPFQPFADADPPDLRRKEAAIRSSPDADRIRTCRWHKGPITLLAK